MNPPPFPCYKGDEACSCSRRKGTAILQEPQTSTLNSIETKRTHMVLYFISVGNSSIRHDIALQFLY